MDKLERYLDQVCRGVGGPRSLRSHIRQELREHLLDASAEHRAAGLSEEESLERALTDFGGAEQVRAELETTHGHRVTTMLIDKAIEWKEKTMKATWLWSTWAHLAVGAVILAQLCLVGFAVVYVMPVCQELVSHADSEGRGMDAFLPGSTTFLGVLNVVAKYGPLLPLGLAVAWGAFEWRFRSENKALVRLAMLATAALGLMAVVAMTAAVVAIPMAIASVKLESQHPEDVVVDQADRIDSAVSALEKALTAEDWDAAELHADDANAGMRRLRDLGAAANAIVAAPQQQKVDEVRLQIKAAKASLHDAYNGALQEDADKIEAALVRFRAAYGKARDAGTLVE
jgi:hypothetical protein